MCGGSGGGGEGALTVRREGKRQTTPRYSHFALGELVAFAVNECVAKGDEGQGRTRGMWVGGFGKTEMGR